MLKRSLVALLAMVIVPFMAQANYVGSEIQTFNPTASQLDFFTIHSSRVLPVGTVKASLFADYAENIHYSQGNQLLSGQLSVAAGLFSNFSLGVSASGNFIYEVDAPTVAYTDDNFSQVRIAGKYNLLGDETGGLAVVLSVGYGLLSESFLVGDTDALSASLEFAADKQVTDNIRLAANLGYRYKMSEGTAGPTSLANYVTQGAVDSVDEHHLLASVGASVGMTSNLTMISELYSNTPIDQLFDFANTSSTVDQKGMELLLGFNVKAAPGLDIGIGGTVGVLEAGNNNADWRAFLGLGYAFGENAEAAALGMGGLAAAGASVPKMKKMKAPVVETPAMPEVPNIPVAPVSIEDAPVIRDFTITANFATGSANLGGAAQSEVNKVGAFLTSNPYNQVYIQGHTDSQGNDVNNTTLSKRRAQAVKNYLVRNYGIPATKISVDGLGETTPIDTNDTAEGRRKNRRVEVQVK